MIKFKRFLLVLGLTLLLPATTKLAPSQDHQEGWQVYTNGNFVQDLALEGGGALGGGYTWVATDGGVVCYSGSEQIKFTNLDGLANNRVYAVAEYSRGLWWFGTDGGVSVLDDGDTPFDKGDDTWITFTKSDGLADNEVEAIVVDYGGRLWFGTDGNGVSVLDHGDTPFDKGDDIWASFTTDDGLADNEVEAIVVDYGGRLWFGTDGGGVSVLDHGSTPFDKGDDTWISFTTVDGLAYNLVLAVSEDGGGRLWFGTLAGVSVLDDGGTPFDKIDDTWVTFTTTDGLADDVVFAIAEDGGGGLWFGTLAGVSVLDNGGTLVDKGDDTWITFTTTDGLADSVVYTIAEDEEGGWWFGTYDSGVSMLDNGGTPIDKGDDTWVSFTTADGLVYNTVYAIAQDGGGQLWFGTAMYASVLDDGGTSFDKKDDRWTTFTTADGLASNLVNSIVEDEEGRWWFGSSGVSVLDDGNTPFDKGDDTWITFTTADGLAEDTVWAIAKDGGGRWWFGTQSSGVSVLDDGGTLFDKGDDIWTTFTTADGLGDNRVNAITEDAGGQLWFGTNYGGVSVLDNAGTPFYKEDDTWATFTQSDGLTDNSISVIHIDGEDRLWFGTISGVSVLDNNGTPFDKGDDNWITFTTADGLAHNWVRDIVEDDLMHWWFGTVGGVNILDDSGTLSKRDDIWTTFTTADGLAHNWVHTIFEDGRERRWFGTGAGASELVDALAPTSSASSPAYADGAISVSWSASDGASGVFSTTLWVKYGSGGTWKDAGLNQRGESSGTFIYTITQGDGDYYFATVAEDWMGNIETTPIGSGDDSTVYDSTAPSSNAASPDYDNAGDIAVSWAASDATSGVSSTALWVKYGSGGSWTDTGLAQTGATGAFYYTPAQGDGMYYFATVAADNAGNTQTTPSGSGDDSTVYDTLAPGSNATSSDYDNAGDIAVSWAASDATSGVSSTAMWVKYGSGGSWSSTGLNETGDSGIFNYTPAQGDGVYYFATVAADNAGNVQATPSGSGDDSTIYDTVAPTASASSPATTAEDAFLVTWSGADVASGVASYDVQYRVGSSGMWQNWQAATTGTSAAFGPSDPVVVQDGTYYFRARARDRAGNVGVYAAGGDSSTNVTTGAYEPNDTCAQANAIPTDSTVQDHTFHTPADTDWVTFDAISGVTYLIQAQIPAGSPADVVLEIHDQCTAPPVGGQGYTFSPGVHVEFQATANGPLYLKLLNHNPAVYGANVSYHLSVRALDDAPTPGAVVIVAGRLYNGDYRQSNIHHVTDAVYRLFQAQGYDGERIHYLATDLTLDADDDGTPDVDGLPSPANLAQAITQWALDKVGPDQPLTLYLVDHGDYDLFYLNNPLAQTLNPDQLDSSLDVLEMTAPGTPVNVIVEACHAGSFIDLAQTVSAPGRLVIASTGAQNLAWASTNGAAFSDPFLQALGEGTSLYGSFQEARWAVQVAHPDQTPWLDSDGDGVPNEGEDWLEAAQRSLAYAGALGGWSPYVVWAGIKDVQGSQGTIEAEVRDDQGVSRVWAVVYPPSYQVPDPGATGTLVLENLATVELADGDGDGVYSAAYDGFDEVGAYRVVVYAQDGEGLVGRPQGTGVHRVFLPLVAHNYSAPATFPLHIGDAIPAQAVSQQGEVFYSAALRMPETLPPSGRFYFSSQQDALAEVLVDDELAVLLDGAEVFVHRFSDEGAPPAAAIVEVERATLEALAGRTVTVEYRDVYGALVEASAVWLIWSP